MKFRTLPALLAALVLTPVFAFAQAATPAEIISASCLIAFGRPAEPGELNDARLANKTLAQLVEDHRAKLKGDVALQSATHGRAEVDAIGSKIDANAVATLPRGVLYAERTKERIEWLQQNPDAYREVLNRAYQHVIRRDVYPEEIAYWKAHGTLPYVVLVGALENWAVRNQPGLMVTTGTPAIAVNSRFLRTQRVPLALANEARELLGLPVWTDVARQHSPGRNIVAVGAKDIESIGGVHFLLAGGGPLAEP